MCTVEINKTEQSENKTRICLEQCYFGFSIFVKHLNEMYCLGQTTVFLE